MLISGLSTAAVGLLVWPLGVAGQRLSVLTRNLGQKRSGVRRCDRRVVTAVAVLAAVVSGLLAGIPVTIACALLVAALALHRRSRARAQAVAADLDGLACALHGVVVELRAGTDPIAAVETVARESQPDLAARLRGFAVSVRLHGKPDADSRIMPARGARSQIDKVLAQVAAAWSLAALHGVPLAGILEAVHRDVAASARSARQRDARLAGARAGGAVLAALPVAGVLLGESMGAGPVSVLTGASAGAVLFLIGSFLLLAGVAWTARLTSGALS